MNRYNINIRISNWIRYRDTKVPLKLNKLGLRKIPENLPDNVINLELNDNHINVLENLPPNLQILSIINNDLNNIQNLPTTLKKLDISENNIIHLNNLPNSLIKINASDNIIESIDKFPIRIEYVTINNNNLQELPDLSNNTNLISLECTNNKLNILPIFPDTESLEFLDFRNNNLTTTTNIPELIDNLNLLGNPLESISVIPTDSLDIDDIDILTIQQLATILNERILRINEGDITREMIQDRYQELQPETQEELQPETQEELQNRVDTANTSLQNIHSSNIINIQNLLNSVEDTNIDDVPLYLQEIDSKEADVYKERCNNTEDLLGDNLNSKYGNIVILDTTNTNKYIAWCFTYPEALEMWKFSKTYNVLSYTGQIINQRGVLLSRLYNTFVLRNINTNTSNYSGHHYIKPIYTLDPIPRDIFIRHEKVNEDLIKNFVPTINDLNLYYLNNPYTQPNNNNVDINSERILGNLGEIILNNPLMNIVKIIKDNEVGDINKSYSIIGDIINISNRINV